jgi:hypothetical protein
VATRALVLSADVCHLPNDGTILNQWLGASWEGANVRHYPPQELQFSVCEAHGQTLGLVCDALMT